MTGFAASLQLDFVAMEGIVMDEWMMLSEEDILFQWRFYYFFYFFKANNNENLDQ